MMGQVVGSLYYLDLTVIPRLKSLRSGDDPVFSFGVLFYALKRNPRRVVQHVDDAATVVIWFLQTFDIRFNVVADQSQSLLAGLGSIIAPALAPLGFGDWRASTALVTGLIAKESVISTLTVLLGATSPAALSTMFSPFTAYVFLVFTLLYPPCVAAIGAVKSELGARYAVAVFAFQVTVAWIVAFVVHSAGILLGLA